MQQYAFGSRSVLVAPVTRRSSADAPLARELPLWVPPGEWVQLHTGATLRGPKRLLQAVSLDEIPVLVEAGSIIFGTPTAEAEWPHCSAGASSNRRFRATPGRIGT